MAVSKTAESTVQVDTGALESSPQATTDSPAQLIITETSLAITPPPTFVGSGKTANFTFTETADESSVHVTAQLATVTPVTFARNGIALTKEDAEIVDACHAAMQAVDLSSRKFGQDAEALYQIGTKMVEKYKDQGHSGKHRTGLTLRDAFAAAQWSYDAWRQWKSRMLAAKKFLLNGMKGLGKKERVKAITGDTLMDVNTKEEFKVDYVLSDTKVGIKKNGKTVEVELYDKDLIRAYENVTPTYTALVRGKDYRSGKDGIVVRLVRFDKEGMPVFEKLAGRTQADIDEAKKNDRLAMKAARKAERDEAKKKEQEAKAKNAAEKKLGLLPPKDKDKALIAAAQANRGKKPSKRRKQKEEGIIVARLDTKTTWGIFDSSLFAPFTLAKSKDDIEYPTQAEAEKAAEALRQKPNGKPKADGWEKKNNAYWRHEESGRGIRVEKKGTPNRFVALDKDGEFGRFETLELAKAAKRELAEGAAI
jgi:hypothetical protein